MKKPRVTIINTPDLSKLKDRHLFALYGCAKKSGAKPFFTDPKAMIALRHEVEKRRGDANA